MVLAEGVVPVTLSLGVATSDTAQDLETFLAAADVALYRAKDSGRNRMELATLMDMTEIRPLKGLAV
jgi:PleD family two-component response regulator